MIYEQSSEREYDRIASLVAIRGLGNRSDMALRHRAFGALFTTTRAAMAISLGAAKRRGTQHAPGLPRSRHHSLRINANALYIPSLSRPLLSAPASAGSTGGGKNHAAGEGSAGGMRDVLYQLTGKRRDSVGRFPSAFDADLHQNFIGYLVRAEHTNGHLVLRLENLHPQQPSGSHTQTASGGHAGHRSQPVGGAAEHR